MGFAYNKEEGKYRVDEKTMLVVRRIFRLIGDEGQAMHRVKRMLEAEAIPTGAGREGFWHVTSIRRMIENDVYRPHTYEELKKLSSEGLLSPSVLGRLDSEKKYGVWWFNRERITFVGKTRKKITDKPREEWVAVPVPDAGISGDTVERARDSLKGNFKVCRADNRFWPLNGHAFCVCGSKLLPRARRSRGYTYHYYVCSRYDREGAKGCEQGRWHRAEDLETRVFWAVVGPMLKDPEAWSRQIQAQLDSMREALRAPERQITVYHEQLAQLEKKRGRYLEQHAAGIITSLDELKSRLAPLGTQMAAVEQELKRLSETEESLKILDELDPNSLTAIALVRGEKDDDELLRDMYRDLRLRVAIKKDGSAEVTGHFGLQNLSPTVTNATRKDQVRESTRAA